jgi:hypothetical protein
MFRMSNTDKQTPLTEQQARALAHWWGGAYREGAPAAGWPGLRHGVLVNRTQADQDCPFQIFSLEEAQEMENRRGFQEAASPDWVG